MTLKSLELDMGVCNAMIATCDQAGQWQRALDVFLEQIEECKRKQKCLLVFFAEQKDRFEHLNDFSFV